VDPVVGAGAKVAVAVAVGVALAADSVWGALEAA
jgi:hypothetical protein